MLLIGIAAVEQEEEEVTRGCPEDGLRVWWNLGASLLLNSMQEGGRQDVVSGLMNLG